VTEIERRERLIEWLEIVFADVQHLLLNDHVFWEFQKVVGQNDQFLSASGLFTQFVAEAYAQSAAVGVRRHAKIDDSISAVCLLREVRDYPELVSRAHYIGLYAGKERFHIEIGQHDFDRVAGVGAVHVPATLADQQIRDVKGAAEGLEHYVDRRVAHNDKRDLTRPLPKFSDLTDALRGLEKVVILYWRLLKEPSMTTIAPIIMNDWKDIFASRGNRRIRSTDAKLDCKGVGTMAADRWELLEARVIKLEGQNRRLRTGYLLAGLAVVCAMTLGLSNSGNTVEAQRFVLKNTKGEVRAELTTLDGDYPRLNLSSPNGEMITELSPLGVSVIDKGLPGKLPLAHFGNTGLYFTDKQGRVVIELGGASTSALQLAPVPEITIFNEKGQPAWHAP
jgi:hypothetical protein